jgi:hypothetical protein
MELDDLKRLWEEQDRKLDASLRLSARALEEVGRGKAEAAARRMSWSVILEMLLAFLPVYLLGSFVADHIGQARFWIPAAALDVFAIATFGGLIRQQAVLRSIDWSAPVLEIQRTLAAVRVSRVRATQWTFFLAPLLWPPLFIVVFEAFLGVDAYRAFGGIYVAGNVVFGLVFLALAVWVSRRFADRFGGAPIVQRFMRDLAGHNLAAAQGTLGSLDRFGSDAPR